MRTASSHHCISKINNYHIEVNAFVLLFYRVDGVLKHVSESRGFEHRLQTLENQVTLKHFSEVLILLLCVILDTHMELLRKRACLLTQTIPCKR